MSVEKSPSQALIDAALALSAAVDGLAFAAPVSHRYNPLAYAWAPHEIYLRRYGATPKRVIFVGMNPGPFGMVQCGVPFGEIAAVRDWLGIEAPVGQPARVNPKRPIEGFACARAEVSGKRLWGLFAERFGSADAFFDEGRNLTPDKLPAAEQAPLYAACDAHLRALVDALAPEWVIGIGGFAEARAQEALAGRKLRVGRILHPSPASPAANRGWATAATTQLEALGVW